jgi:hypothetical protein
MPYTRLNEEGVGIGVRGESSHQSKDEDAVEQREVQLPKSVREAL